MSSSNILTALRSGAVDFIDEYLRRDGDSYARLGQVLEPASHIALVDDFFDPMIEWVYARIKAELSSDELPSELARLFICELSIFARYNSQFLWTSAEAVRSFCPELAHELFRNHLEEGGERGKLPAHYAIFSNALLADLKILIHSHVPVFKSTTDLVAFHSFMAASPNPSYVLGMYYATEGVAIAETRELRRLTDRYGDVEYGRSGTMLPLLDSYYRLHLDSSFFDGPQGSVEQSHQDGIAHFVRNLYEYGFDRNATVAGFLQMLGLLAFQWSEFISIKGTSWSKSKNAAGLRN